MLKAQGYYLKPEIIYKEHATFSVQRSAFSIKEGNRAPLLGRPITD
ncbi:hypothetical protein [Niastella caeni]|nr:hypothetical protein [Niastella caeni]